MMNHWSDIFKPCKPYSPPKEKYMKSVKLFKSRLNPKLKFKKLKKYELAKATFVQKKYLNELTIKDNLDKLEVGEGFLNEKCSNWYIKTTIKNKIFKTYNYGELIVRVK